MPAPPIAITRNKWIAHLPPTKRRAPEPSMLIPISDIDAGSEVGMVPPQYTRANVGGSPRLLSPAGRVAAAAAVDARARPRGRPSSMHSRTYRGRFTRSATTDSLGAPVRRVHEIATGLRNRCTIAGCAGPAAAHPRALQRPGSRDGVRSSRTARPDEHLAARALQCPRPCDAHGAHIQEDDHE